MVRTRSAGSGAGEDGAHRPGAFAWRAERLADPIAEPEEEQAAGIPVEPSEAWPAWEEEEDPPRSEAVLEKLLARTERLSEAVVRLLAGLDGI